LKKSISASSTTKAPAPQARFQQQSYYRSEPEVDYTTLPKKVRFSNKEEVLYLPKEHKESTCKIQRKYQICKTIWFKK
jgi:predicted ATP-grasp superfamily ATP-dependent carboligase